MSSINYLKLLKKCTIHDVYPKTKPAKEIATGAYGVVDVCPECGPPKGYEVYDSWDEAFNHDTLSHKCGSEGTRDQSL